MKIGFIQTGAIGDILIAMPAAKWYVDKGFQVFWPIDSRYFNFFKKSAPYVDFISIPFDTNSYDWHLGLPLQIFQEHKISEYFILYSYLGSNGQKFEFGQPENLPHSLKFDEYKYAITQVPFSEKWNLYLERDMDSEAYVLDQISSHIPYTVIHNSPAGNRKDLESHLDESDRKNRFINITNLTPNPFDWISAFENSQLLAFEDSLHANVVEQLNLANKKYLFLRSSCNLTPVFKNSWIFK
jgi:hypothetical protein